jgi:predicted DNA-binding protein|tara:strand:+ start:650 stop:781 length:132 start_codon:yes stop_codon:yes gene_type:complete
MHTTMPDLLFKRLTAAARRLDRSRASLVRRIITQWLDSQETKS